MKNLILLLSFILLSFNSYAQYFEVGMEWIYVTYYGFDPSVPDEIVTMKITGETVVNGNSVFVLGVDKNPYSFYFPVKYISEEGKKVFYYQKDDNEVYQKELLYDFSLAIGDTLEVKPIWSVSENFMINMRVESIDELAFGNETVLVHKTKCIGDMGDTGCMVDFWEQHVEGIGAMTDFFPRFSLSDTGGSTLRCVRYPSGKEIHFTNDADCLVLAINDIKESGLSIYPNPVSDWLTIKNPKGKHFEVEVYDVQGRLVYSEKLVSSALDIDASIWKRGVYSIRFKGADGVYADIFVKE